MFRFLFILVLLSKYSLIYCLLRFGLYKKPKQKILRNFFEEAGGSFIKFGQILALRVDVIPQEYVIEMINLFDNVKPFPYEDVERIFLQELGATPQKIFKDFQKKPFASASFGQVHGAKLENDHIVAVKIMRPGIEEKVTADFFIIDILASLADMFFKIEALPWKEIADEFKKWTINELDYHIEAENMIKMYKNASVNKNIVIPKVYTNLSTKKILVEDYIEGIPLSRVLLGLKDGRLNAEKLEKRGINIKKTPRDFSYEIIREFIMDDLFHADPHPGNLLLLKNDRIALLDFGIVGKNVDKSILIVKLLKSYADLDIKKAIYYFGHYVGGDLKSMIGSSLPGNVSQKMIDDFANLLSSHFSEAVLNISMKNQESLLTMKKDYSLVLLEVIKAAQKYKVKVPKQFIILIRTLAVVGLLAKQLDPTYKIINEIKRFFKIHPLETLVKENDQDITTFKRISREKAIEQLNSWLSYLIEIDPPLYHLVKDQLKKYNSIDK